MPDNQSNSQSTKFTNTLYIGDNLYVLNGLNSEIADLIYLDPPFNSNRDYNSKFGTNFSDIWGRDEKVNEAYLEGMQNDYPEMVEWIKLIKVAHSQGMCSYITYMAQRILEMKRILKSTGSLYYHCDQTAGAYVKGLLDFIFGKQNFRNEICWCYERWNAPTERQFQKEHDTIYYYSKDKKPYFNCLTEIDNKRQITLDRGYTTNLLKSGVRQLIIYEGNEEKENIIRLKNSGKFQNVLIRTQDKFGKPLKDWWTINFIHPKAKERIGQKTQKPLALLDRIIKSSCPEGGLVLDPFCGCATTCISAELNGRKWIGIDIDKESVKSLAIRIEGMGNVDKEVNLNNSAKQQGIFNNNYAVSHVPPHRTDLEEQDITKPKTRDKIKEFLCNKQKGFTDENGMRRCLCNGCFNEYLLKDLEIDHIVPKAKGGGNYVENYQLLCGSCNRMKGANTMEYLRMKNKAIRKIMQEIEFDV